MLTDIIITFMALSVFIIPIMAIKALIDSDKA